MVAAPIKIGNTDYYMGVMLQRDARYQRLYLHNVVSVEIERKAILFSKDNLVTTGALEKDNHLSIASILQNAVEVKINKQNKDKIHVENSSGERHALPKTDKNSAKQGASTVADPDKIEVRRGNNALLRAWETTPGKEKTATSMNDENM